MLALVVESWIWYAFATGLVLARLVSRTLMLGSWKKLQPDDWLMLLALAFYTTFMVAINIVANENSNLLPPGFDYASLTPTDIAARRYGSKLILVVEQCQCATIWLVKSCLLIMYYRLMFAMNESRIVKGLAVYVAVGFVLMEILYFAVWCRPFHNYWAVPTPNTQCSAATNHLITNAVFNISSDLVMLIMAMQMIIRTSLPLRRKAILCLIFGLAVFSILSAVLNKYYSFSQPFGVEWTYWYVRESSTSILVANLPYTWHLLRRVFKLAAFDPNASASPKSPRYHSSRTAWGRRSAQRRPTIITGRAQSSFASQRDHDDGTGGKASITSSSNGTTSASTTPIIPNKRDSDHSGHTGHRGGGRSARSGTMKQSVSRPVRPASGETSPKDKIRTFFDMGSWHESSMSSRSDGPDLERGNPQLQELEQLERVYLPPDRTDSAGTRLPMTDPT